MDQDGKTATARVGQYTRALSYPPGQSRHTPKVVLTTARLPMTAFQGVDLKRVKAIEFVFDSSPSGAIFLTDIALVRL